MMLQANPRLKRKFVDTHQQQEQPHPYHHTINFSPTESPIPASNQITTPVQASCFKDFSSVKKLCLRKKSVQFRI
ncbi:hypothetical protein Pst134EA_032022 [Puccinia striiformis f. sp. tritici]|nr:uncharacterized protein Pst134EA_032022 [Puccinia striiformis f. sp. tritici]KAH9444385.1 hypothetical protein Pst134EA_032022 [Puccinia striiformis f. sp. tritici]